MSVSRLLPIRYEKGPSVGTSKNGKRKYASRLKPGDMVEGLIVVRVVDGRKWLWRCPACGSTTERQRSDLEQSGATCCSAAKARRSRRSWILASHRDMINRCEQRSHLHFDRYGDRGIKICERWRNSFEDFYEDTKDSWFYGGSVDRHPDNDGDYEPENFRWATRPEQARNTSANRMLEHNGRLQCVAAWADEMGMSSHTLRDRLRRGWSIEKALTTPVKCQKKRVP